MKENCSKAVKVFSAIWMYCDVGLDFRTAIDYIHKSAKNCDPLADPCEIQESNRKINNTLVGQGYDYCECGDGVNRFYWILCIIFMILPSLLLLIGVFILKFEKDDERWRGFRLDSKRDLCLWAVLALLYPLLVPLLVVYATFRGSEEDKLMAKLIRFPEHIGMCYRGK